MRSHYTKSADYIRGIAVGDDGLPSISRSQASRIRQAFAHAIDMDDENLSEILAALHDLHAE